MSPEEYWHGMPAPPPYKIYPPLAPPRGNLATDIVSGLLIGIGAFIAILGGIGYFITHDVAAQCSNNIVSAFNQSACIHDGNMADVAIGVFIVGLVSIVAGIITHLVGRR